MQRMQHRTHSTALSAAHYSDVPTSGAAHVPRGGYRTFWNIRQSAVPSQPQQRKQRQCNAILSKSSVRSEHDVVVGAVLTNPPIALRDRLEELHAVTGLLTPHSVECAQRHVSHVAWYPSHRSPHSRCCHYGTYDTCAIAHASHAALYTAHRDECAALLQRRELEVRSACACTHRSRTCCRRRRRSAHACMCLKRVGLPP